MVVVICCDVPLTENNGTAVAANNLINALKNNGDTVRVIAPMEKCGYDCYVSKKINFGILNNYVKKNGVIIARSDYNLAVKALQGADILHIITPFFLCRSALKAAKDMNIPVTAGFHCQAENFSNHIFMMNNKTFNNGVYKEFYRAVYSKTDCIHYPTEFIKGVFEEATGCNVKSRVISNGVGEEFTNERAEKPDNLKDKKVILFTGRYSKEKSHRVLIDAVCKSKHKNDIQLIFAGNGPREKNIRKYCESKKINPPIMKFFDRSELINIIHYSDLYVHPAEIEIEAISCLEAIRGGLVPVVSDSTRSATRFFALDERNKFACNNSDDLAEKIDYWISNEDEKRLCAEKYKGYTAQFDKNICMEKMLEMISETVRTYNG